MSAEEPKHCGLGSAQPRAPPFLLQIAQAVRISLVETGSRICKLEIGKLVIFLMI